MHTLTRFLVPVTAVALGCGGETPPTAPAIPGPLPVLVAGSVRDSLLGVAVPDALVTTAIGSALTDQLGRFSVAAPRGRARIHVAHASYSLKSFERVAEPDAGFALDVAPLGPTVVGCDVRQGVMWMLVVELQGRKTVVRRDSSGVTLGRGGTERWIVAHDFTWWALDPLTWLVEGPPAAPDEIGTAEWRLFDTDGNLRPHGCGGEPVPGRDDDDGGGASDSTVARTGAPATRFRG